MPTYEFKNIETGEIETHVMSVANYDEFKLLNPHLERFISGSPGMSDPVRLGVKKPAQGFRDLLKSMKKAHRRSTINDF